MARVYDGLMLTVFLAVGVIASLVEFEGMAYAGNLLVAAMAFLAFGVGSAFVLVYLIASHPHRAAEFVRVQSRRIPGLHHHNFAWLDSLIDGLGATSERDLFIGAVWTSAIAWGMESFMYYLVGQAFGLGLPFPVYLLVAAAANIIITAPATSGGVGPFEWAAKEVLLIYLVGSGAEELAIAFAASLHGLVLVPIALVGLLFLWIYQIPMRHLGADPESRPDPEPH